MIVSIHQPHYLPWLGLLDKMAQSDVFIVLDDVQLTDQSPMLRNKLMDKDGAEIYLTVDTFKKHYHDKKTREIEVNNAKKWQKRHERFFLFDYKKHPYFEEVWPFLAPLYQKEYTHLINVELDAMAALRALLDIQTPLVLQSALPYDQSLRRNALLIDLLKHTQASCYLSGRGARAYMDPAQFRQEGIDVFYQCFTYPQYPQRNAKEGFLPNLSSVDLLMNCGIDASRRIFRENMQPPDPA